MAIAVHLDTFFLHVFFPFMLGGVRSVVGLCCRWRHGRRCMFVACVGRQTIYVLPVEKHCIFGNGWFLRTVSAEMNC